MATVSGMKKTHKSRIKMPTFKGSNVDRVAFVFAFAYARVIILYVCMLSVIREKLKALSEL